jgi:hypothetical protein
MLVSTKVACQRVYFHDKLVPIDGELSGMTNLCKWSLCFWRSNLWKEGREGLDEVEKAYCCISC